MRFSLSLLAFAAPLASAQLHALAKKAGLQYFGTASDIVSVAALDKTYAKIISDKREFGQLTPANGQKWFAIEPQENLFNFSYGDVTSKYAKKNKQLLRCHNLVWHSQLADWVLQKTWTKKTLTAALINHVTNEAKHWKGQCYHWDVVNEALEDDGSFRNTTFLHVIGPEYIAIAFKAAHAADPHAKLYYNDYNLERPNAKVDAVINKIVKPLQRQRIPIHGVGMQAHLTASRAPTIDQTIDVMKNFTNLGVECALTELDVRVTDPATPENMAQQKVAFAAATGACVQVKGCVGVTVWDFWDPVSWIPGVFAGQGSGTLFFPNFTRHPAYDGVADALKNGTRKGWSVPHYDGDDEEEQEDEDED
ncbi:(Trans)glycosidase [Glarea lozoyensis ATCC 20868]|uniref:Beta-xylanase n=2 Tax=Glarea lozoyensis TaxID=101852 RepID=S3D199_GLAL2|nr:(Trans)glycosidase [Glarea lozoyensis ATCC 20868]EHL03032.1 putative endo-1,4-beta-xylanase [Glarea lozoyensis 74030]EPE30939.1 (Trans)glycosidase [Glarea lozoyensis ATCC 20868]